MFGGHVEFKARIAVFKNFPYPQIITRHTYTLSQTITIRHPFASEPPTLFPHTFGAFPSMTVENPVKDGFKRLHT